MAPFAKGAFIFLLIGHVGHAAVDQTYLGCYFDIDSKIHKYIGRFPIVIKTKIS